MTSLSLRTAISELCRRPAASPFAVAVLLALAVAIAAPGLISGRAPFDIVQSEPAGPKIASRGRMVPTQSSFIDDLNKPEFWAARRAASAASKSVPTSKAEATTYQPLFWDADSPPPSSPPNAGRSGFSGEVRTMCVRLCDGYYWPISYGGRAGDLDKDEEVCKSSCTSPTRLFVIRGDGEADTMEDLSRRPYSKLENAFAYRTSYNAECKCKPHPWEQAAIDSHRIYAAAADRQPNDRASIAETTAMASSIAEELPPATRKAVVAIAAGRKEPPPSAVARRRSAPPTVPVLDEDGEPVLGAVASGASKGVPWASQRMGLNAQQDMPAKMTQAAPPASGGGSHPTWRKSAFSGN